MADAKRYEAGAQVMKQLFGVSPDPSQQDDFMKLTTENLFGDVWNRPGLELHERSLITCAALTVLAREPELRIHMRGAKNLGITREKLSDMLIHLAHYGGWPVAVGGFRALREVFDKEDG